MCCCFGKSMAVFAIKDAWNGSLAIVITVYRQMLGPHWIQHLPSQCLKQECYVACDARLSVTWSLLSVVQGNTTRPQKCNVGHFLYIFQHTTQLESVVKVYHLSCYHCLFAWFTLDPCKALAELLCPIISHQRISSNCLGVLSYYFRTIPSR